MNNQREFELGICESPPGPVSREKKGANHPASESPPATRDQRPSSAGSQNQLRLAGDGTEQGYTRWLAGRRVATQAMAQRMGLPLGHQVEVWLIGGIRLRGKLRLQEEVLFIEEENVRHLGLMVDNLAFAYREMESCVRLD
jgi:hypothetical protein